MDFTGKHVTGAGKGKGIGRATAVMLANRGAKVTALSRSAADPRIFPTASQDGRLARRIVP